MFSSWSAIDPLGPRHEPDELPEDMHREGEYVISSEIYDPICLSDEDSLSEIFRLSSLRKTPDKDGWHNHSVIVRTAKAIGFTRQLESRDPPQNFTAYLRNNPMIEMRDTRSILFVRPIRGKEPEAFIPVIMTAICPGDSEPRQLYSKPSFGAGYRTIAQLWTGLIAHNTQITLKRGNEERRIFYSAQEGRWRHHTGELMKRQDPSDPVLHRYKHGHTVGTLIGFVSQSKSGRFFANVGIPIDSPGDDDAFIQARGRVEAETYEEALAILEQRDDLDHLFSQTQIYNNQMGFWLSGI